MARRTYSREAFKLSLEADRGARPEIRETCINGRGHAGWRGRSGNRYVFAQIDLTPDAILEAGTGIVVIAVRRDAKGEATIVDGCSFDTPTRYARHGFYDNALGAAATELWAHRLAATPAERIAVLRDLNALAMEAA